MMLEVKNLTKKYGNKTVLDNFTYKFTPGIYGILGRNGAGKSTLFGLLTNTINRTSGEILWNGQEIKNNYRLYTSKISYMPQTQGYYPRMSGREFLFYIGQLKGQNRMYLKKQIEALLRKLQLEEYAEKKFFKLSGGMRQRMLLAASIIGDPDILFLDEPTAGVDALERIRIRNIIAELSKNKIILLATHVVSDIEIIAKEIIILNNGKTAKFGTPEFLINSIKDKCCERNCTSDEIAAIQKKYGYGVISQTQSGLNIKYIKDKYPDGFTSVKGYIGLEEVYLYYCND